MARAQLLGVLALVLVLASCGGGNENQYYNPEHERYFTGTEGIVARYENLPQRLYYYGPEDNSGNYFSFGVELNNEGASASYGGVFVSGYDPRIIVLDEVPIVGQNLGACGISIGNIGFGEIGGILRCEGGEVGFSEDYLTVDIRSLGGFIGGIGERFNKNWWKPEKFDFGIQGEAGGFGTNFVLNWNENIVDIEYYQNGRLFIAFMSWVNFIKYSGREFLLAGDTYEWPGGEYEYFVYNGRFVQWPPGLDETQQSFLLTTCYTYTTFASPIVCIDPEPYSENRKVCRSQSRSYGGGNGAPVAITSIEQENTPRKIIFHINVRNVGLGTVYDPGKLEKCSPYYPGRVTPEDLNVIWIGDVRIGNLGLEGRSGRGGIVCSPSVIRLDPRTGTGSTTCTYPLEFTQTKSAYQAPLTVELWYGYSETEERKVHIKRVV